MRSAYQGVSQIVRFNWPQYAAATIVCTILALTPWRIAAWPVLFWTFSSLLASYYVYDKSRLFEFDWLSQCLSRVPRRWLLLHAGLDESSHALAERFPGSLGCVLDIYDPTEMTEKSIARARAIDAIRSADWRALPVRNVDTVFVIFTAHELRRADSREELFRQMEQSLNAHGEVLLVEHLRNFANFAVFGPGFLHFFSRRTWLRDARSAGLQVAREVRLTPFVRAFVFRRLV